MEVGEGGCACGAGLAPVNGCAAANNPVTAAPVPWINPRRLVCFPIETPLCFAIVANGDGFAPYVYTCFASNQNPFVPGSAQLIWGSQL
jgi:hypothetical protein